MGFNIFPASVEPSAFPAPTMVWSSSMNNNNSPFEFFTSFKTALSRSSNSPLYFAPATSEPMSSENILLFFKDSGTSLSAILWARPSTMAVFPTPGSPMSTGLFLVFRDNIIITFLISVSRPMMGSSSWFFAFSTSSVPYFESAS